MIASSVLLDVYTLGHRLSIDCSELEVGQDRNVICDRAVIHLTPTLAWHAPIQEYYSVWVQNAYSLHG